MVMGTKPMIEREQQTKDDPMVSAPDIAQIVKRLDSENTSEREEAERAFRALIEQDLRTIRRGRRFMWSINVAYCATVLPMLVYDRFNHHRSDHSGYIFLAISVMFALNGLLALHQRPVGRRLAILDAPQAVGPLMDVLSNCGMYRWSELRRALIHLLPRLKVSDTKWLLPRQRKMLLRILTSDERWPYYGGLWGSELKIAILRALEQIGDAKAIPTVERMARSAKDGRVRIAAQDCLPFLRERVEEEQIGQNLLRASGPNIQMETLLRPASGNTEDKPEQLLHPSCETVHDMTLVTSSLSSDLDEPVQHIDSH